jgi:hypothetical protein
VIWNLFCFSSCWDCSLWYNWGILVSLSEFSPQAFAYFRIRDNPYLGNLNVNVESFTSNILILDPCFSSCLVGRPTFGNVDQWPTNEQWSIEKKKPIARLDYKCEGILFVKTHFSDLWVLCSPHSNVCLHGYYNCFVEEWQYYTDIRKIHY